MDALSDVLRVVRLKGGVFLHAEFTSPWCILSQVAAGDLGSLLGGGYESETAFNRAFKRSFGLPPAAWRKSTVSEYAAAGSP